VYARPRDSFGVQATRIGEAFAAPAAVSVANARALAQAERLVTQLSDALRSRAEIDQALGIVMSRTGDTSEQAFTQLREQSQTRQLKLVDVARELIADAVAHAKLLPRPALPEPPA
jgi:AmiR/NasT family two-component response regulator